MKRLVLGLDIGITSVGYGLIDIESGEFVDYGVRLFKEGTAAENEKEDNLEVEEDWLQEDIHV